ncbi:TspO/MBR family protein [Pelodictyon phaeoclathratiforme]|jgi:tryptophan-rich sensory protein|uniref:TspO and MBR like protein n=1 Tax=Pelodictyon phaeoclathratiforme (strain DSM 5477 / BU-1) TaxID=324925 RepID=B4SDX0_PELPB|nr:TspO/MBR family protein [Pelodictyon phaeoclathratiforme]ACF42961.1 TspO and MBR like protein [Pelodictyon phaeoclathratiforme BU-1]MBV5289669.1 tryptophan-rich sensory protein [Pelodictyon phaeoclathratiforme]
MNVNIPKLALCIGLCFVFAFAGSTFTPVPGSDWYYHVLNKPSWNPPDWLFPPAWSLLFLLMGIALYLVVQQYSKETKIRGALIVFGAQLLLNLGWSAAFFGLHSPVLAMVVIVLLWLAIVLTIVKFRAVSPMAGNLLIPYLMWVTFASFLNFTIVQLN